MLLTTLFLFIKSRACHQKLLPPLLLGLAKNTNNALHITLNGIVKLIRLLLTKIKHVLTVEFHSDRIEGEFGIYQQLSG